MYTILCATHGAAHTETACRFFMGLHYATPCTIRFHASTRVDADLARVGSLPEAGRLAQHSERSEERTTHLVLDRLQKELTLRGPRVDTEVVRDAGGAAIVQAARRARADVVVLSWNDDTRIGPFHVGGVPDYVVDHSPVGVLILKGRASAPRQVVVGTDDSLASAYAIEQLSRFPLPTACVVTLLHVLEGHADPNLAQARLDAMQERLHDSGLTVETKLRRGSPAEEIVRAAHETDTDLVVLGTRSLHGVAQLLHGKVARRVAHSLSCSVLVFRYT